MQDLENLENLVRTQDAEQLKIFSKEFIAACENGDPRAREMVYGLDIFFNGMLKEIFDDKPADETAEALVKNPELRDKLEAFLKDFGEILGDLEKPRKKTRSPRSQVTFATNILRGPVQRNRYQ